MPSPERGGRVRRVIVFAARMRAAIAAMILFASTANAEPPPFAEDLERLAEILGSLQFLAELCEEDPTVWRGQMESILGLTDGGDESDAEWQARLTNRFNLGYSSFAAVYRNCTAAALTALVRYREAGAAITADIAARYGATPLANSGTDVTDP